MRRNNLPADIVQLVLCYLEFSEICWYRRISMAFDRASGPALAKVTAVRDCFLMFERTLPAGPAD